MAKSNVLSTALILLLSGLVVSVCNANGDEPTISSDLRDRASGKEEALIQEMEELFDKKSEKFLPVVEHILSWTEPEGRYDKVNPVKGAAIQLLLKSGTPEARRLVRDQVAFYVLIGPLIPRDCRPRDDYVYTFMVSQGLHRLVDGATEDEIGWFHKIATDARPDDHAKELAYMGFLKGMMHKAKIKDDAARAEFLLNGLRSNGRTIDCYHNPLGRRTWTDRGIQDYARVRLLNKLGKDAIPVLEREYRKVEHRESARDRRFAIAEILNHIRQRHDKDAEKLPIDVSKEEAALREKKLAELRKEFARTKAEFEERARALYKSSPLNEREKK